MLLGFPFCQITFSSVLITLLDGKDIETSWATAMRSLSSMTLSTRNFVLLHDDACQLPLDLGL